MRLLCDRMCARRCCFTLTPHHWRSPSRLLVPGTNTTSLAHSTPTVRVASVLYTRTTPSTFHTYRATPWAFHTYRARGVSAPHPRHTIGAARQEVAGAGCECHVPHAARMLQHLHTLARGAPDARCAVLATCEVRGYGHRGRICAGVGV